MVARYRPRTTDTSVPVGSFPESSILATVPMRAKVPSVRGTSSTNPLPCLAASIALRWGGVLEPDGDPHVGQDNGIVQGQYRQ